LDTPSYKRACLNYVIKLQINIFDINLKLCIVREAPCHVPGRTCYFFGNIFLNIHTSVRCSVTDGRHRLSNFHTVRNIHHITEGHSYVNILKFPGKGTMLSMQNKVLRKQTFL